MHATLTGALGGNGTLNGVVTVTSTGHLAPAMSTTTSNTLTIANNLTINAGGTLDYNFGTAGTPGTSDLVSVTVGTHTLTLNTGADVLNVNRLAGFGVGTYTLFSDAVGTITTNGASALPGAPAGALNFAIAGSTLFNYWVLGPGAAIDATAGGGTVPATQIRLEVLAGNPNFFWTGAVNGAWDVNTTSNWTGAGPKFTTGGNVTFDDANLSVVPPGATSLTVVAGGVTANSIVFNSALNNFTIGGGAISVTSGSGVTKNQAGSVTLNGNVTTPLTTINAGIFGVGAGATYASTTRVDLIGGTLGVDGVLNTPALNVQAGTNLNVSATGSLASTTALTLNGAAGFSSASQTIATLADTGGATTGVLTLTGTALTVGSGSYDGVIAGNGSLLKNTAGNLLLTNAGNSFSGSVTVANGTLGVGALGALGTGVTDITLGGAATAGVLQYLGNNATLGRGVTLAAGGGSIEVTAVGVVLTISSTITNGANTLTLLGTGNGNIASVLAGTGNVNKQGTGEWALSNTATAPGATTGTVFDIQNGTLTGVSNGTISSLGGAAITLDGGTLGLSSTATATFDNAVTVNQNAAITAFQSTVGGGSAGQTVTLGGTKNMTVASTKTVTLSSGNNDILNVAGNITGLGGVTESGGAVQFTGSTYSYSGATAVTGGTLTATSAISGTSGVTTSNNGIFFANGGLTTAGAIVTNNTSVLTAGGAVSAASVTVNNTSTFNANAPVSVNNVLVNAGTYNSAAALTAPGGFTITGAGVTGSVGLGHVTAASGGLGTGAVLVTGSGSTLQFDAGAANTATAAPSSITNNTLVQVKSGTAELGTLVIGTGNAHDSVGTAEQLSERYLRPVDAGVADYLSAATGDPGITFESTSNFASRIPGGTGTLGTATPLSFTGAQIQARPAQAGLFGTTDNMGAAWLGTMTVGGANLAAGDISFGTRSDDGSSIYVDLNRDGVFQANERVVNNLGSHGDITVVNTVNLAAGTYKIAIGRAIKIDGGRGKTSGAQSRACIHLENAARRSRRGKNPGLTG